MWREGSWPGELTGRTSVAPRRSPRPHRPRRPRVEHLEGRSLLSTYGIGPGQAYETLGSFPWSSLSPGDTVEVHWRSEPYREKLLLSASGSASAPITIVGVPGPGGQRPVIDGQGATTSPQFQYFYDPIQENSLVLIQRSASQPRDYRPSHITIAGLELRNAYQSYNFTDSHGMAQAYSSFAASIYIEGASDITIRGCTLDGSGLGLFALTNDSSSLMTRNVRVEGNSIYGNGVPYSYYEHNVYTECDGVTFEANDFGPLRPDSYGAQLKDRSAGTVIAYNHFEPASTILDLVDAEDSPTLAALPSYENTYVYSNILDNTGPAHTARLVHFGGDSGDGASYRPNLAFYDNTVVNVMDQSSQWRTYMFASDSSGQSIRLANNIFYNGPATPGRSPSLFEFSAFHGNVSFEATNWASPGWLASESVELGTAYDGTVAGTGTVYAPASNDPGFADLARGDYRLASTSGAIGLAGPLDGTWPAVAEEYVAAGIRKTRTWRTAVGAC